MLVETIDNAIELAEELGLGLAAQILMMARQEVKHAELSSSDDGDNAEMKATRALKYPESSP